MADWTMMGNDDASCSITVFVPCCVLHVDVVLYLFTLFLFVLLCL